MTTIPHMPFSWNLPSAGTQLATSTGTGGWSASAHVTKCNCQNFLPQHQRVCKSFILDYCGRYHFLLLLLRMLQEAWQGGGGGARSPSMGLLAPQANGGWRVTCYRYHLAAQARRPHRAARLADGVTSWLGSCMAHLSCRCGASDLEWCSCSSDVSAGAWLRTATASVVRWKHLWAGKLDQGYVEVDGPREETFLGARSQLPKEPLSHDEALYAMPGVHMRTLSATMHQWLLLAVPCLPGNSAKLYTGLLV